MDKTNASAGLRFLPEKDANSFARREDGSRYVFAFDAYPSAFFNDSGVVEISATAQITVTPVNDPPTLDRDGDYALTGVYFLDNEVTNFGDPVSRLVKVGFHDIDGPYSVELDNTGVVVVDADQSRGAWEYTADHGANWTRFPLNLAPDRPLLLRAGGRSRAVSSHEPRRRRADGGRRVVSVVCVSRGTWRATSPRARADGSSRTNRPWCPLPTRRWRRPGTRRVTRRRTATRTPRGVGDGAAFDAEGEISMSRAAAWIEVYGLEHSAHMMGSARQTEAEHEKLRAAREAADGCPPPHGVYARVDAGDFGSSLTAPFVDENTTAPNPRRGPSRRGCVATWRSSRRRSSPDPPVDPSRSRRRPRRDASRRRRPRDGGRARSARAAFASAELTRCFSAAAAARRRRGGNLRENVQGRLRADSRVDAPRVRRRSRWCAVRRARRVRAIIRGRRVSRRGRGRGMPMPFGTVGRSRTRGVRGRPRPVLVQGADAGGNLVAARCVGVGTRA